MKTVSYFISLLLSIFLVACNPSNDDDFDMGYEPKPDDFRAPAGIYKGYSATTSREYLAVNLNEGDSSFFWLYSPVADETSTYVDGFITGTLQVASSGLANEGNLMATSTSNFDLINQSINPNGSGLAAGSYYKNNQLFLKLKHNDVQTDLTLNRIAPVETLVTLQQSGPYTGDLITSNQIFSDAEVSIVGNQLVISAAGCDMQAQIFYPSQQAKGVFTIILNANLSCEVLSESLTGVAFMHNGILYLAAASIDMTEGLVYVGF